MSMITIYAKPYTDKYGSKGTEYYRDKDRTDLIARDPYKRIRKDQIVTLNCWKYFATLS